MIHLLSDNSLSVGTGHVAPAWDRLLRGPFGKDDGWLLPAAAVSLVAVAITTRRRPDQRKLRAALLLWGGWLVLFFAVFSAGIYLNSYYTAVLIPAIAALCGIGFSVAVTSKGIGVRILLAGLAIGSAVEALFLIPGYAGARAWLIPLLIVFCTGAVIVLAIPPLLRRDGTLLWRAGVFITAASLLLVPAAASVLMVVEGFGPFDYPFEPNSVSVITQIKARAAMQTLAAAVPLYQAWFPTPRTVVATETSVVAELPILETGKEFLPIGGFLGGGPEPSLGQLKRLVQSGRLEHVIAAVYPPNPDPRLRWVRQHCASSRPVPRGKPTSPILGFYSCFPPRTNSRQG